MRGVDADRAAAVQAACERWLSGHPRRPAAASLRELAEASDPWLAADNYGAGDAVERLERRVAALLGKEAAAFMPSGTMAQQTAVRVWADRQGSRRVAMHPTCHLELREEGAYRLLHGLDGVVVGRPDRVLAAGDLCAADLPLAALVVELPQRETGGQLPTWEALGDLVGWARRHGVPLHLDGARLWECGPYYARPYPEIAGLFDTVYVSFYKGLGAWAGAALAGPAGVIAECRVWQKRHGGNLIRLFPYALSAAHALDARLDRMAAYRDRAVALAAVIGALPGVRVAPDPPVAGMLHVHLPLDAGRLRAALVEVAARTRVWIASTAIPLGADRSGVEIAVGDATFAIEPAEAASLFERLLA
jgi:threonine aldolase